MKTSETVTKLYSDYIKAQTELVNLGKDSKGYGYNYTSLDKMIEATKPTLQKHNLAILQMPIKDGLISRLIHSSGEWIETVLEGDMIDLAKMNKYQVQGSQLTYFRRYAWASICGIASDDDLDANAPKEATPVRKMEEPVRQPQYINEAQLKKINTLMSVKKVDRDQLKAHYKISSFKAFQVEWLQDFIKYLEEL